MAKNNSLLWYGIALLIVLLLIGKGREIGTEEPVEVGTPAPDTKAAAQVKAAAATAPEAAIVLPQISQASQLPEARPKTCAGLLFSTSEDFLTRGPTPPDGNPVISDGDLLAWDVAHGAQLCMRNIDLLRAFDLRRVDLGLDAVAAIDDERSLLVFSTEMDSANPGQFTQGDLLFQDGGIIPNNALLARFALPQRLDLGLDAMTLLGTPKALRELARLARSRAFHETPDALPDALAELDADIWFSTEGTAPPGTKVAFLDGDLLSARHGTIVRSNQDLLPALPAGLPNRGADFGLDAYTPAFDVIESVAVELMSTEIVGDGPAPFTDGDALQPGPSIWLTNESLLMALEPVTADLGLDALHERVPASPPDCAPPQITHVSMIPVASISATTGLADHDGVDARPFAGSIRIQGSMPNAATCPDFAHYEYRVEVDTGSGFPVLADPGITHVYTGTDAWRRIVRVGSTCPLSPNDTYESDPFGWFAVSDYRRFDECGSDASLAVWESNAPGALPDTRAHTVRFRVVMREAGASAAAYVGPPVKVRIDNHVPLSAASLLGPSNDFYFDLWQVGATSPLADQCKITGNGTDVVVDIRGQIFDEHFYRYEINWSGGAIGNWQHATAGDPTAFDSGRPNLNDTGTHPSGTPIFPLKLGFNLSSAYSAVATALGITPTSIPDVCGFTFQLKVWDRAWGVRFKPATNDFIHPTQRWDDVQRSVCVTR